MSACRTALRVASVTTIVSAVLAAVACAATDSRRAPRLRFGPTAHADTRDVAGGPLDLTSVTFGQQDTQLVLRLQTASPWKAGALSDKRGRALCVVLSYHRGTVPRTRICVVSRGGDTAALSYAHLDSVGRPHHTRSLTAFLSRPDKSTLSAAFTPLAARLPRGRIAWQAESLWTDHAACAAPIPCVDDVPDRNAVIDRISLVRQPRCFGAASRDPRHPCHNRALRRAVVPTPADALITPNAYCKPVQRSGLLSVCAFGATAGQATATIALVGDSHAEHWRGALEVVAQARHWRGLSITRAGCPFTRARLARASARLKRRCTRWSTELRRWFTRHRKVTTVAVSAHALTKFVGSAKAGYQAAWRRLPASVRHIVVIHDTPETASSQTGCVQRALAHHRPTGPRCAQSRRTDLRADPEADAAYTWHARRAKVVDLTHYMCGRHLCFAVVGGALVRKDTSHLTSVFSTSLGPYLLRAIDRVVP